MEHKNVAVKFLVNRVQNYLTSEGGRRKELTMIKDILDTMNTCMVILRQH
jgi:hypothetical protein